MLEPSAGSSAFPVVRDPRLEGGNESLTEGYGEQSAGARALGGGVDFFSSLGKERERKPKPDVPNPDKVCLSVFVSTIFLELTPSSYISARKS